MCYCSMWHDIGCHVVFVFLTILCYFYHSYKNPTGSFSIIVSRISKLDIEKMKK
jgi:hypothetical protein